MNTSLTAEDMETEIISVKITTLIRENIKFVYGFRLWKIIW